MRSPPFLICTQPIPGAGNVLVNLRFRWFCILSYLKIFQTILKISCSIAFIFAQFRFSYPHIEIRGNRFLVSEWSGYN